MKIRILVLLPLCLGACGSMLPQSSDSKAPSMLAGNLNGVAIRYDGTSGGLHEAELVARHDCEKWGRNPGLLNEAPMADGSGSLGYFVCQ